MGKTPKLKKREISQHSRAARRGASPPTKDLNPPTTEVTETEYKPWLHSAQNAGISKKKKTKQLTRQQKLRQQRGLENAERNLDKHEKKVADSKTRGRKVQARRQDWEELNEKIEGKENVKEPKKESGKDGDVEGAYGAGGEKAMEGVDLEKPLEIRVVEGAGEETKMDDAVAAVAAVG